MMMQFQALNKTPEARRLRYLQSQIKMCMCDIQYQEESLGKGDYDDDEFILDYIEGLYQLLKDYRKELRNVRNSMHKK